MPSVPSCGTSGRRLYVLEILDWLSCYYELLVVIVVARRHVDSSAALRVRRLATGERVSCEVFFSPHTDCEARLKREARERVVAEEGLTWCAAAPTALALEECLPALLCADEWMNERVVSLFSHIPRTQTKTEADGWSRNKAQSCKPH